MSLFWKALSVMRDKVHGELKPGRVEKLQNLQTKSDMLVLAGRQRDTLELLSQPEDSS